MTATWARLLAVAAAALIPFALSLVILALTPLSVHESITPISEVARGTVTTLWALATMVVYLRQPSSSLWKLLLVSAWVDQIWVLPSITTDLTFTLGWALRDLAVVLFAHIVVSFPTGDLKGRLDRWLIGFLYAWVGGLGTLAFVFWDPGFVCAPDEFCARNLLLLFPNNDLHFGIRDISSLLVPVVAIVVVAAVVRHYRQATPIARRPLGPVVFAVAFVALFQSIDSVLRPFGLSATVMPLINPFEWVIAYVIPGSILLGALRLQLARGGIADLVLRLGRRPEPREVERELRLAFRDPGLSLLFWSPAMRGYVDAAGASSTVPAADARAAVTLVERDGLPLAVIVHDRALLDEPELLPGVAEALRLVVERDRLEATVRAQVTDARALPTGQVTFLYADIEGSTGLLHRLGDRYGDLLAEHRRMLSAIVRRAGGREVDARADEYFAVFVDASRALEAALAIQRRVASQAWPNGELVRDRIGLHAGTPELTDDGYVGLDVHRAARVGSAGHGGQIVVSETAREVIGDELPLDVALTRVGSVQLRGLPSPETLYEVVVPDLERRLEPLRT